jgi:glycine/serine hydroxymethyltransferase
MTTEANQRMQRPLDVVDPRIADLLRDEPRRQATGLELIPSENLVSEAVLEAMASMSSVRIKSERVQPMAPNPHC